MRECEREVETALSVSWAANTTFEGLVPRLSQYLVCHLLYLGICSLHGASTTNLRHDQSHVGHGCSNNYGSTGLICMHGAAQGQIIIHGQIKAGAWLRSAAVFQDAMDDVDVEALSVCALEWMADAGHLGCLREQCERHQQEGNDVGTLTSSSHWRSMNKIKIKAAAARFGSYPERPSFPGVRVLFLPVDRCCIQVCASAGPM